MVIYPGTNPVTPWISFSFAVNYGKWPSPVEAEGGNQRSAANLMTAVESLTDRTNLLGWRCINIVDGATYTFVAAVNINNAWTYTNSCTIAKDAILPILGSAYLDTGTGGLGTLYVGFFSPGHIIVGSDSDITVQGTSGHKGKIHVPAFGEIEIESGGVLNTFSGGTANLGGQTNRTGATTLSGTGSFRNLRVIQVAAGVTVTINGGDADIFDLPATLTGAMTLKIATNATAAHHRFVIRTTSNTMGFDITVSDAGGTRTIGKFYNAPGALSVEYQGAIEYYYSASGAPTVLFVNTGIDVANAVQLASVN